MATFTAVHRLVRPSGRSNCAGLAIAEEQRAVFEGFPSPRSGQRPVRERRRESGEARAPRRNRRWTREHPGQLDEASFKRQTRLGSTAFSLKEIAKAQGYRSRRARASERLQRCRTRGTGKPLRELVDS